MKELKSIKFYSLLVGILSLTVIFSSVNAQEYDDMYFNKSDRKKIKTENSKVVAQESKAINNIDYNQAAKSTEVYSAKNVNPEYIARYKATEANEIPDITRNNDYSSEDYFIEDYNASDSAIGSHKNQIDYAALNKRDQMSYSSNSGSMSNSFNRYSNPYGYRGFSPYMGMGYDPFMMGYGYGPSMSMGMGYGFGSGFYPSMSYSLAMSWGSGYNPWGGWGANPYYSPYGMRGFNDPWGMRSPYGYGYGGYSPYYASAYGMGGYGSSSYYKASSSSYYDNGRNIAYKPRTTNRSATVQRATTRNAENTRISTADSKIRVPSRATASTANGRVSRDYSKSQNEYYSRSKNSSSAQRISTSNSSRKSYTRSSGSSARYTSSSISNSRPSRAANNSTGFTRSSSRSSYSGNTSGSRSSSYSSSPSRSGSSSFNRSSYSGSSGSGASYSGSRSSGSSSSGSRSSSGGGSSRSGGRQ